MVENTLYFKTPFIEIENYDLDVEIVKLIPEEMARYFQVIALEKYANILTVGMVNPKDKRALNILEAKLKCKVMPIKILIKSWAEAVNKNYINNKGD